MKKALIALVAMFALTPAFANDDATTKAAASDAQVNTTTTDAMPKAEMKKGKKKPAKKVAKASAKVKKHAAKKKVDAAEGAAAGTGM